MRLAAALLVAGFVCPAAAESLQGTAAVLQGLDKVTARVRQFDVGIDQTVAFGTLAITVRTCRKSPPEEPPEQAAFLQIVDNRPQRPPEPVFSGWMFASSPGISALEHPVYDVWVIDCRLPGATPPAEPPSPRSPPARSGGTAPRSR